MGALRQPAGNLGSELREYYLAALEFIDPVLTADSPLEDILMAVSRRRVRLHERPLYQIEDELSALNEALDFVQRVQSGLFTRSRPGTPPPEPEFIDVDIVDEIKPLPAETSLTDRWIQAQASRILPATAPSTTAQPTGVNPPAGQPTLFTNIVTEPPPAPLPPAPPPVTREPAPPAGRRQPPPVAVEPELAIPPPAILPAPQVTTRRPAPDHGPAATGATPPAALTLRPVTSGYHRRSLREAMEAARHEAAVAAVPTGATEVGPVARARPAPPALPETLAWPVAVGLALIGWHSWLAAFSGWTLTRFLTWPRPGVGYGLHWAAAAGLILLGTLAALVVGRIAWIYRRRTRRLELLVHLSAAVIAGDLLAWWLAQQRLGLLIEGPQRWQWLVLGLGWLAALQCVRLNDLLNRRAADRTHAAHRHRPS